MYASGDPPRIDHPHSTRYHFLSLTETFLKISPADNDWTGVTDTFRAIEKPSRIVGTPALRLHQKRTFSSTELVNPSSFYFYFYHNLIL